MDPNSSQFLKVYRGTDETLICYKEIYGGKRKAAVQSSFDNFVRKTERAAASTSSQLSTFSAVSASLIADVDSDYVNAYLFSVLICRFSLVIYHKKCRLQYTRPTLGLR